MYMQFLSPFPRNLVVFVIISNLERNRITIKVLHEDAKFDKSLSVNFEIHDLMLYLINETG